MKQTKKQEFEKLDTNGWQLSGYVEATNLIRAKILNDFNPLTYVVYEVILSHKNTNSITSFPSIQLVANECGISKRAVEEAIAILHNKGYLLINSGKTGVNNNYYFPQEEFHKGHENDVEVQMAKRRKGTNKKKENNKNKKIEHKIEQLEKENNELKKDLIDYVNSEDALKDTNINASEEKEIKNEEVKQKEVLPFMKDPDYDPFSNDD